MKKSGWGIVLLSLIATLDYAAPTAPAESEEKPKTQPLGAMNGVLSQEKGAPYVIDPVPLPFPVVAFDFFSDGAAMLVTPDGRLVVVEGANNPTWVNAKSDTAFMWQVIATGMTEPRGLRILDDMVYVTTAHSISRVTSSQEGLVTKWTVQKWHEYKDEEIVSNLDIDAEGRFYLVLAKQAGETGHMVRMNPDTGEIERLAGRFLPETTLAVSPRASVAVCGKETVKGEKVATRVDWIAHPANVLDEKASEAVLSIPTLASRFPGEICAAPVPLAWVPDTMEWRSWRNELLLIDAPHGRVLGFLQQIVSVPGRPDCCDRTPQGAVVELVSGLGAGTKCARFSPVDHQLYVGGSSDTEGGWLKRVRVTEVPPNNIYAMRVMPDGLLVRFTCSLNTQSAADRDHWKLDGWDPVQGTSADISVQSVMPGTDDQSVFLEVKGIRTGVQYRLRYDTKSADGATLKGDVAGSVQGYSD